MTLCGYGMAFAPRHQVHLWSVASLAHLRWAHRLGCSLAGLFGKGEGRVGSRTSPQLQITPFVPGLEPAWVPVPVPAENQ